MRFGMIADDVTGACDAGVQFAVRGFSAHVWLNAAAVPAEPAELTVFSTNTRNESAEDARAKVLEACAAFELAGIETVYKKIDSTLLGNIGPEIDAVLDACGFDEAWVAPAFPAMGRRPLHLPALLKEQGASNRVRPFDAETQADLTRIARAALDSPKRVLLAGSAGLAIEVAALLAAKCGKRPKPAVPVVRAQGPLLFVIGSVNPVTAAQVAFLRRCSPGHIVRPVEWRPGELDGVPDLIRSGGVRGLVFSGGDTARLACRVLQAGGIRLDREILTGIPCGTLAGGPFDGLPVATKAGGFGREDALAIVAERLTAAHPASGREAVARTEP